jgi:hypothetical protein
MGSFEDNLKTAIRGALCIYASAVDNASSFVSRLGPTAPDITSASGFLRRVICDEPGPDAVPPPFEGGQCPGVSYRVNYRANNGQIFNGLSGPIIGPLTEARWIDTFLGFPTTRIRATGANGTVTSNLISDGTVGNDLFVVRSDGQPDTCGDPAPDIPEFPSEGDTINIDFNYTSNSGQVTNVQGDFRLFAPILIAPVTIVAPITVNLPDLNFNGQLTLAPEFRIELFPRTRSGTGTDIPDEPDAEPDPDDPDEPEDCSDRKLLGLLLVLAVGDNPRPSQIFPPAEVPDLLVPRAAYVWWIVRVGGRSVFLPPVEVKTDAQFVPAPQEINVVCWRVTTEQGISAPVQRPVFVDTRDDGS